MADFCAPPMMNDGRHLYRVDHLFSSLMQSPASTAVDAHFVPTTRLVVRLRVVVGASQSVTSSFVLGPASTCVLCGARTMTSMVASAAARRRGLLRGLPCFSGRGDRGSLAMMPRSIGAAAAALEVRVVVCNLEAHRCFAAPVGRRRRFAGLPLIVPDCSKVTGSSSTSRTAAGLQI